MIMLQLIISAFVSMARTTIAQSTTSRGQQRLLRTEDIFAVIWDQLSDVEKRTLGKQFHEYVVSGHVPGVTFHHKNAAGLAYYKV